MADTLKSTLPIILLAAGQSARMRGRDKLMEDIDGVPLIRRQVARALAATSGSVIVALPSKVHPRAAALDGLQAILVDVPDASLGMSASLRRALAALPDGCPAAMVLLPDLPDITSKDITTLLASVDLSDDTLIWRGTTSTGAPGHPVIFAATLFPALADVTGDNGGAEVIRGHAARTVLVPLPGQTARRDLDTPEDWAAWRAERDD